MNQFEVDDDLFQKKEDSDGTLPHLRLSGENRSDRSVGSAESIEVFPGPKPPGRF
jgi:hypothetical protein